MSEYNLERFKKAQDAVRDGYAVALEEMKNGKKISHWIWYIFPQLKGLGWSSFSKYYGITDLDEAREYLADELLEQRLREIIQALLEHSDMSIKDIFPDIDVIKVRSCMTLFDLISPNDVFAEVLNTFFDGKRDKLTINKMIEVQKEV